MAINVANAGSGIARLTLDGREKRNFLDTPALLELAEVVNGCRGQPQTRVLVVTGRDGTFCGGRQGTKGLTRASDIAEDLNAILNVNAAFNALSIPVVAAVEGEAFGFAFGLSAQADYVVAAENATFALPEMSHGLPPLIVFSYLFRFVSYKRAFELALTSRPISAREAMDAGVVTEVVKRGAAVDRALEVGRMIAGMDGPSIALMRKFARESADVSDPQRSEYAVALMSVLLAEKAGGAHPR